MTPVAELSRAAIAELDPTGQLADVMDLPEHLRDALWRVESAALTPHDSPDGLVVAGMGGSAIGGALARAALGDRASRPITIARGYALPPWTTPDTTVLCASYSGNTEETLAAFEAAGAVGARRIVTTTGGQLADLARDEGVPVVPLPGGYQPRAAVGYGLVVSLEVAALAGICDSLHTEIDVASGHAGRLVAEWGPDSDEDSRAKRLARSLHGTVPQIAGAGLTAAIAYRWKTQINENAKLPAFAGELPEIDHNEIVGWEGAPRPGTLQRRAARRLRPTSPRPPARPADPGPDRRPGRIRGTDRVGGGHPPRAPGLPGPARRSGVGLHGDPAGRGPSRDRRAAAVEADAG